MLSAGDQGSFGSLCFGHPANIHLFSQVESRTHYLYNAAPDVGQPIIYEV